VVSVDGFEISLLVNEEPVLAGPYLFEGLTGAKPHQRVLERPVIMEVLVSQAEAVPQLVKEGVEIVCGVIHGLLTP
jgi:hypothetical protein